MKITFIGAAREVTGSKTLIETDKGKRILLDCGVFQGKGLETEAMNRDLPFHPASIDHIILTHAHIDHSGLIPYMYKNGFNGSVVCSNATRDLCAIMLADSGFIQEHDTKNFNKRRVKKGLPPVDPLYTKEDAVACMELFIGVPSGRKFRIDDETTVRFTHTGHMLGSGVANIETGVGERKKRIAYTGDIGRPVDKILVPPAPFPQADILITESTYGDRLHTTRKDADEILLRIVKETCVIKKGKLIIPAFSVGRTQEIVYSLNNLYNEGRLPRINIFVDSPLALNATNIFRLHPECFNKEILEVMETDPDPFGFNTLRYVRSAEESKSLNEMKEPAIIISASGMMEAGRVKHHLANNISKSSTTILGVGYCAPSTLGARILRGDDKVSIHGVIYNVEADVEKIDSFSGHGDYNEMTSFISCQDKSKLQNVFLVHGELPVQEKYREHLKGEGFKNIEIPYSGESFTF